MKRLIGLSISILIFSITQSLYAHPPVDIKIAFDKNTRIIQVEIIHNVSNPNSHYINKVDISLNEKEIIEHKISRQDNNEKQNVLYLIPDAKEGDKISVEAYCNLSGKLEKYIVVR